MLTLGAPLPAKWDKWPTPYSYPEEGSKITALFFHTGICLETTFLKEGYIRAANLYEEKPKCQSTAKGAT
jgi:hypothetical protein